MTYTASAGSSLNLVIDGMYLTQAIAKYDGTTPVADEAVTDFAEPSPNLEQYLTPPEIAARGGLPAGVRPGR